MVEEIIEKSSCENYLGEEFSLYHYHSGIVEKDYMVITSAQVNPIPDSDSRVIVQTALNLKSMSTGLESKFACVAHFEDVKSFSNDANKEFLSDTVGSIVDAYVLTSITRNIIQIRVNKYANSILQK